MSQALIKFLFAASISIFLASCSSSSSDSGDDGDNVPPPDNEVAVPPTTAGDILFNEVMAFPDVLLETEGEWFEVRNPTASKFTLRDCVFLDGNFNNFIVDIDLEIGAGELRTFAISANPGFTPDFNYNGSGLRLSNYGDTLTLACNGVIIDRRIYTGAAVASGRSSSRSGDGSNKWCLDLGNYYYITDRGTPGEPNVVCA